MAAGDVYTRERNGRKFYEAVVDLGKDSMTGRRRQQSKSFAKLGEARKWLAEHQTAADKGLLVDRSRQTVAEMMHEWLATQTPNVRPKTALDYERIITNHIIPDLGAIPIQKLTAAQLQRFYAMKQSAGCGARTLQMCHQRLSQALKQAVRLGLVARSVADMVTPPRAKAKEMGVWDGPQARRFIEVATHSPYGPIWIVALATGLRRGELLGLRWKDVDCEAGVLSIQQTIIMVGSRLTFGEPKTAGSRRSITVDENVVELLRAHKARQNEVRLSLGADWASHDLVFTAENGQPIHPSNLTRDYNRLVVRADVPRIRIHDVRHTAATLLLSGGVPLAAVSEHLGHARQSTTLDFYSHVLPQQRREIATKMGAILFAPTRASGG